MPAPHEQFRDRDLVRRLAAKLASVAAGLDRVRIMHVCGTHEHEIGRSHVGVMAEHLDAAAEGDGPARAAVVEHALAYADLLEAHIQKEDGILFNMADRILPEDEQERLEEVYRTAVPVGADAGTGARYEELARTLCERWQIDPDKVRAQQGGFGCHGS